MNKKLKIILCVSLSLCAIAMAFLITHVRMTPIRIGSEPELVVKSSYKETFDEINEYLDWVSAPYCDSTGQFIGDKGDLKMLIETCYAKLCVAQQLGVIKMVSYADDAHLSLIMLINETGSIVLINSWYNDWRWRNFGLL